MSSRSKPPWYLNEKGYPRFCRGPLRGRYVHRVVAAKMLGRELRKDETVHHRDGNKRNFRWQNLRVMGEVEHGYVSARQRWYLEQRDIRLKVEWEEYFEQVPHLGETEARL